LTALGNDVVGIGATAPDNCPTTEREDGYRIDEWGFVYRPAHHAFGTYYEIVGRPLQGISTAREVAAYRMPDPGATGRYRIAAENARRFGPTHALLGVIECTVFEMAWNLVGLEAFLADMMLAAGYVEPLLDAVTEYSIAVGVELIRLGADVMLTGDDLGMETGPMLSPRLWRRYLKPRLQRVFEAYRAARPDILLAYHSCGSIRPFIPELVELGLDILNPIQTTARNMDPGQIKAEHGERLSFCGGIDQRHVMPAGTTEDVAAEARRRIRELGAGGGYILAPSHDLQSDTPVENVLALFEAARQWGTYPLQ
jgi:uroporphyrinogen decarboxylase